MDRFENERLRLKVKTDKGKVFDIMVQYETKFKDQWKAIVRYDCAHGFIHRDFIYPNGNKDKKVIGIADLEMALDYAEQDIKDHWDFIKKNTANS